MGLGDGLSEGLGDGLSEGLGDGLRVGLIDGLTVGRGAASTMIDPFILKKA